MGEDRSSWATDPSASLVRCWSLLESSCQGFHKKSSDDSQVLSSLVVTTTTTRAERNSPPFTLSSPSSDKVMNPYIPSSLTNADHSLAKGLSLPRGDLTGGVMRLVDASMNHSIVFISSGSSLVFR